MFKPIMEEQYICKECGEFPCTCHDEVPEDDFEEIEDDTDG